MSYTLIWKAPRDAARGFLADKAMQMAAALAFYTISSLGPILLIVISVAGLVWGEQAARGEVVERISGVVGEGSAAQIEVVLAAARDRVTGGAGLAVGLVLLLLAATGVVVQLKASLNAIWSVQPRPGRGVASVLRDRLVAIGVVTGVAILLIASLVASTVLSAAAAGAAEALPAPVPVMRLTELAVSWAVVTMLLGAIFKYLPDIEIRWRDVLPGAAATAVLFIAGRSLLGLYLGGGGVTSVHGAAGSLVAILLWVYYSAIILLFGAELTQAIARRRGAVVRASRLAMPAEAPGGPEHGARPAGAGA